MKTNLDKLLSEYSILSSNHRPTKTRIIDPFHKKLKPFTVRISTSHKSLRALAPREKPAIKLKPRKSNGKRMEKLLAGLGVPLIKLRKTEKNSHILNTPLLKLAEILELPKSQGQRYESYFPVIKKSGDKIDVQLYPVSLLKSNYSRSKRRLLLKKDKPFFTDTSIPLSASATCPQNVTVVYTDGSCKRNGKADSVAGIGVFFGEDDPRNVSERIAGNQTNQRAELHAALKALQLLHPNENAEIRSDSKYLVDGMNVWSKKWIQKNWMVDVGNKDLFKQMHDIIDKRVGSTMFTYVKGHSGTYGNDGADRLAVLSTTLPND